MKKLKGILLTVVTVILTVAMLVGTATVSVFADNEQSPNTVSLGSEKPATLVRKVNYGDSASKIKNAAQIIAPSGMNIIGENGSQEFDEIGAYTVKLENGYSYVVSCTLDKDYELRVAHNGADIPTYIKATESFVLPAAALWFKSENEYKDYEKEEEPGVADVYCEIEGATVTYNGAVHSGLIKVSGDYNPEIENAPKYEVTLPTARSYTVHYYCKVSGGNKYISKDYTVSAQAKFEDKTAPSLSLVNIPTNISLNTKVTLPKATATDNYDKNVKVNIQVQEFDTEKNDYVNVKRVELDENGYGDKVTAEDEVFENDYNLSFYPMKATKYKITYSAVDDAGNKAVSEHVYETTASDRTAPVLKNIDEDKIPTVWGLTEVKGKDDKVTVSKNLKFPTPEFVDNSKKQPKVIFELRDTVNNNVVIRFENINDYNAETGEYGDGAKYTYSSTKPSSGLYQVSDKATITWGDIVNEGIDLSVYANLEVMKGKTATGRYTARYEARDDVPHTTSRTFNIDVRDTFADTQAPLINDITFDDKFLVFTEEETEFNVPVLEVSDDNDAAPTVSYKLFAAKLDGTAKAGDNSAVTVKGGEVAKLKLEGIGKVPTLTIDEDKIEFTDDYQYLVYEIVATDDVGNTYTLSNFVKDAATQNLMQVVNGSEINAPTLAFVGKTDSTGKAAGTFATEMEMGKRTTVGGFTVTPKESSPNREFYGFEISVYTLEKGSDDPELWTNADIELKTYWNDGKLYVDDITFAAPKVDKVIVFVRAYGISGKSTVAGQIIKVTTNPSQGGTTSALDWRNEGTVYTEYTIKNRELEKPDDFDNDRDYVVRKIVGNGRFGLTGYRFSAYNAGSFTFSEYYWSTETHKLELFINGSEDTIKITETETPAWNLQSKMPTHVELSKNESDRVDLPKLTASTQYANARIELTATFQPAGGNTTPLSVAKNIDENGGKDIQIDENGIYSFRPTQDGTYTFKYTANYGDHGSVDAEYIVKAGDVIPPEFTTDGTHATTASENDTFEFRKVILGDSDKGDLSKMTFTKTLKGPDGTTVYTLSGTGSAYADRTTPTDGTKFTFTKTGTYTVEYSVKDQAGNETLYTETITVSAANVSSPISTKIISTILIIVGVLLIAGVILYFVRFRKVKSK